MTFWKPGRRLFSTSALLMILTAAAHTLGAVSPWPDTPAEQVLLRAMRGYVNDMGMGMRPTMFDIYQDLSLTMSISLAALGALNLMLASRTDSTPALLRAAGRVNAIWAGAFLVLNFVYQIPPPLICAVAIEIFVLAALFAPSPRQLAPGTQQR